MLCAVVILLATGCSTSGTPTTSPQTVTVTAAPPTTTTAAAPSASGQPTACTDDQLDVTNAPLESADTLRRVVVTFKNTSSQECALVGYPGADLVTPSGGVLINVAHRPANAAHHLRLAPGDKATADVQSYAVDTKTGDACPRYGTLVVTPQTRSARARFRWTCRSATQR